jgi:hypothetical protein
MYINRILNLNNSNLNKIYTYLKIQSPNETECIIDISVGGWLIPYAAKGHLSVWAISNIGKVRKKE